jgi:hypothetical protein
MEYIPNYPIAACCIDDEMANNIDFKTFIDVRLVLLLRFTFLTIMQQCIRHPDAHRLDTFRMVPTVQGTLFAMLIFFSYEFFLPSESFDLVFLKAKIAILCAKGFEIMDLTEYVAFTTPPIHSSGLIIIQDSRISLFHCVTMFHVENEFLLCYDG